MTIDFEETARGNALALGEEFLEQGLRVIQRAGQPLNIVTVSNDSGFAFLENASSGRHVLSSSISLGGAFSDVTDDVDFLFSRPKHAAGLWIGNIDPGSTEVQFLDVTGQVLASETFTGAHPNLVGTSGGHNRVFYGVVSDPPVARIRIVEGAGDSDGVTFDDVQFSAANEHFELVPFRAQAGWSRAIRDFELAAGSFAGNEYAAAAPNGVQIVHRGGEPISVVPVGAGAAFPANAQSGTRVLSASIGPDGSFVDRADDLDFVFAQPMRAAGLWVGNLDPGTTEVQFLDAAGGILARETLDSSHAGVVGSSGGDNRVFYGITSDAPIARIRVVEPAGDSDGITFDDLVLSPDLSIVPRIRVLTTNIWQGFPNAIVREARLVEAIRILGPDLVAFQEARQSGIAIALAGLGYHVRHQGFGNTGPIDEGVLIASRWPIGPAFPDPVSLEMAGADEYPYGLVRGIVSAPAPFGAVYFLNAKPAWQTSQAPQRALQGAIMLDEIATNADAGQPAEGLLQIVAGDFDDAPTTQSILNLTGPPELLRDAWVEAGDGGPGFTFSQPPVATPALFNEYALPYTGPNTPPGAYEFGDRRIDYLFAREQGPFEAAWHATRVVFDGPGSEWISGHSGVFGDLRPVPEPGHGARGAALLALLGLVRRRRRASCPRRG